MVLEEQDIHRQKKKEKKKNLDSDLTTLTKINSKWVVYINVKHRTIKLLEDNIGKKLDDFGYGDDFLDTIPQIQFIKEVIDKLNFIKIKNFCSAENDVKK